MKRVATMPLLLLAIACTRTESRSQPAPVVDASAPAIIVDASITSPLDAGVTLDAYCEGVTTPAGLPESFTCRGEEARPSCKVQEKKKLATLGKIMLVDEKTSEGTHAMLVLVDSSGHFSILERVQTEDCDLGDPADVSLELVSASEIAEGGAPIAAIVSDSLRIDPPFQGGARIFTGTRHSVRCESRSGVPVCGKPTTLGTFTGPMTGDKPPPFSHWTPAK